MVLLSGDLGYIAYLHGWLYGKELGYGLRGIGWETANGSVYELHAKKATL